MTPLLPILCSNRCLPSGHRFRFSNRPHKLLTATTLNHFLTIIGLLAAVAGMICLFSGSFSENQFKDAVKLKVVVFTILPLLVLVFLWKARKCNEVVEKVCHKHVHIKTVVKIVFLGCATTVNLLIKFPRFNVRYSRDKKFSIGEQGRHSQGSRFNLYSAGSFSAFALVISSKRKKAMELGIFDFLLGLTMDASMEIPGNGGVNLLYMLGAFVYCASLIFIRSCLESFMLSRDISGARQGNIPDRSMVQVEGAREDAAEETVNFVTFDPAAEYCGETIGLPHITMPVLMRWNPMPELMRWNTMPEWMRWNTMPELMRWNIGLKSLNIGLKSSNISYLTDLVPTEDAHLGSLYFLHQRYLNFSHLGSPYFLPQRYLDFSCLVEIDLKLSEFLRPFGDVVIDGVRLVSELFFEDWQKNRVRTDVSDFETESERGEEQRWEIEEAFLDVGRRKDTRLSHGLRRRRRSTMSEPRTYHGDVVKGSAILVSEIPYEGWRQNGGCVSVSESSILESKHGVEQRDEIDGAFLDVVSSEDAYLPDGLRKRRNQRGMKLEIRNVIPGIVKDRLPNLQVLHIRGDGY